MAEDFDILIVGGGMTGAILARALANASYRVGLIEARPFGSADQPSYDDRSIALAYGSRRILDSLDLWSGIAPSATPIKTIHVSQRGRFGATRIRHDQEGVEALGFVVPNRDIGRAAYAELTRQKNFAVLAPARLQDLAINTTHVAVIAACETGGALHQCKLRCKLLVAADGTDSEVRRRSRLGVTVYDYAQTAIVANVTPSQHHAYTAFERFTDTGPIALLPLSEGRCALAWTHTSESAEAAMYLDDAGFLRNLQARFGYRLGRFIKIGARRAYPLRLSIARKMIRPRVVLIGNAAHSLHPVGAQGFNLALRDVAQLVELLYASSPGDPGQPSLLERYAASRQADLRRTVRFTDALARLFTNPFMPMLRARAAALLALDFVSPLRHQLARQAMGFSGRAPRLTSGVPLRELS